jgi:hypothetical protein
MRIQTTEIQQLQQSANFVHELHIRHDVTLISDSVTMPVGSSEVNFTLRGSDSKKNHG